MKTKEYHLKSKEDNLENDVGVTFKEDGTIVFVDYIYSELQYVYLYPKQANKLRRLILSESKRK